MVIEIERSSHEIILREYWLYMFKEKQAL
jgi:hypothetical protein